LSSLERYVYGHLDADVGRDEARQARRLLTDARLHGHKYAIDAVLAVIARQQKGQVTVFTSDVDDLQKLVPDTIVVKRVRRGPPVSGLVSFTGVRVRPPSALAWARSQVGPPPLPPAQHRVRAAAGGGKRDGSIAVPPTPRALASDGRPGHSFLQKAGPTVQWEVSA
jgi:hypothetical protein